MKTFYSKHRVKLVQVGDHDNNEDVLKLFGLSIIKDGRFGHIF